MSQQLTPYQLGIIYSIGSIVDYRWVFRHCDRYFLEQINFCNSIYKQIVKRNNRNKDNNNNNNNNIQYVLKMPEEVIDLSEYNWTNRNSNQRDIPILNSENEYKDFMRAYIEIHGRLDWRSVISHGKIYKGLRLRIYGNRIMMESVSKLLNEYIGVGIKKVSMAVNEKTGILYYQGKKEIRMICEWCDSMGGNRCVEYWDRFDEMMR